MADRYFTTLPPLIGRYWLVASLLLVLLPHLSRLPAWLAVAALTVVVWRLLRDHRNWPLPGAALRFLLTLVGFGAVFFVFRAIIGREPGAALLTVMLALKLLELRTLRDAMLVVFLGYFLVVVSFFFDETIFTGLYMVAAVLALSTSLVALNHPAATFNRSLHYVKRATTLFIQALPLMVVLFILFPRITSPLWRLPEEAPRARTGLSDEMSPGELSDLADSDELVFRAEFSGTLPRADQLYWRGPVLWNTDGRRWQRLSPSQLQQLSADALTYTMLGEAIDYSILLEPHTAQRLFALDLPAALPEIEGGVDILPDFQLLSHKPFTEQLRYTLRSVSAYRTGALDARQRSYALQLPEQVNPRSRALSQQWRAEIPDDAMMVTRALDYFRSEPFYYTRQPPVLGSDAVDEFLFSSRRGFCEHYAAAFVTLMRGAQIPARVVTGYQGGDFNSVGNFLEVRQNRAHAWAEVWLTGRGWVRVDPTSVIPPERVSETLDSTRFRSTAPAVSLYFDSPLLRNALLKMRQGWGAVNYAWSTWVIGFDAERQRALLQRWGLHKPDLANLIYYMVAALALVLTLIALVVLIQRPPRSDAIWQAYQQFRRKLADAGVEILAHEGPHHLHARATALLPQHAATIDAIITLYVALRYGRADPGQQVILKQLVTRFRP
ncbi:MAG TPA: DUF3488 and transglutaminase-like domain-containing protein [Gammaproteobacteria bacterium]